MTTLLHLPPRADAPIACDMSTALDTPEERLAEYGELFERALLGRRRRDDGVVLTFSAGAREQVADLARREQACCPFLDYRVEAVGDEVIWTLTNPIEDEQRAAVDVILDAFYTLPEAGMSATTHSPDTAVRPATSPIAPP